MTMINSIERIALSDSEFERAVSRAADWISWNDEYDEYAYRLEYATCLRRLDEFLIRELKSEGLCEITRASIPCFGATITISSKKIAKPEWFESIVSWFIAEKRFDYLYLSYDLEERFDAHVLLKRNAVFGSGKHLHKLGQFRLNDRPLQELFMDLPAVNTAKVMEWYTAFRDGKIGQGMSRDFTDQFFGIDGKFDPNRVADLEFLSLRKASSIKLADFAVFQGVQRIDLSMATVVDWAGLLGFHRLKGLYCADTAEVDLSMVGQTRQLEWLMLTGSKNLRLSELAGCGSLRQICLSGTKLATYRDLISCPTLRSGSLSFNNLKDMSQLPVENQLVTLDVAVNELEEVKIPAAWQGLKELDIGSNRFQHLRWLDQLPLLHELTVSNNRIKNLDGVEALSCLRVLNVTRTSIRDFGPLMKCPQLEMLLLDKGAIDLHQKEELLAANPRLQIKIC